MSNKKKELSLMNPNAKRCTAISRRTGKRCKNAAMKGFDVCHKHGAHIIKVDKGVEEKAKEIPQEKRIRGGQPGNINKVIHGAYSYRLLPEEEVIYEEKKRLFTEQLGKVDVFDEQIVHILSIISAKLDVSAGKGAPAEALIPISNEILRLLKSLKETRDTRNPVEHEGAKTAADFFEELSRHEEERGISNRLEHERMRIHELELEVNELRKRLGMELRKDIEHKVESCIHCKHKGEHRKNKYGDWVCMKCGFVTPCVSAKKLTASKETSTAARV